MNFSTDLGTNTLKDCQDLDLSGRPNLQAEERPSSDPRKNFTLSPFPAARASIPKPPQRPSIPHANFNFADGLGSFAVSTARKDYSNTRRREVTMTQKIGACFGCKMAKSTVHCPNICFFESTQTDWWKCRRPNSIVNPCERCLRDRSTIFQPCFRLDLADCGFFRCGKSAGPTNVRYLPWVQPKL